MADMADVVDAAEAGATAPPVTKAAPPRSTMPTSTDDTPMEPATSPRMIDSQVREFPVELQLPTGEIGPRGEPGRFATRFILNDGRWTPEEHEALLRKATQGISQRDWNREVREAALREKEAHDRSVEEWKVQVEAQGLTEHASLPFGPPPKETSSMRALPNVHEALRQNDPSTMAPGSTPVLKKPPPTSRYDTRHFHKINSLQRQHLWRHLQQLICRGRVLPTQKDLQHHSCQLQVMCIVCRLVHQQLIQRISTIDTDTGECGQHPTSIGIPPRGAT